MKTAESVPWEVLCVDLIGPYTFKRQGQEPLELWCCTMIDPATGWFEMQQIDTKSADNVINIVDQAWFTRYPWPTKVISDRGGEFMKEFGQSLELDYGITKKTITTRNPQANAMIERIHQTLGNIIRTFDFDWLGEEDPWPGILSAAMFAVVR